MEVLAPPISYSSEPQRRAVVPPSAALLALRAALDRELVGWAARVAGSYAGPTSLVEASYALDHQPAHVGRDLNPEAQTFTLDFLAATEEQRVALRLVELGEDTQAPIEWLMQLPELKRTYGFDTVAGLVVVRHEPHAHLQWQAALARAYDATYFVDPLADGAALALLARRLVDDVMEHVSTVRLWDLWEREQTEADQREYVLSRELLAAYVPPEADPQAVAQAVGWGATPDDQALVEQLIGHLQTLELPYDREVPGGVMSPLLRRYLPLFHWPLVIDDRYALLPMAVPEGALVGVELTEWTTLARCARYWLDKAGDLRWNERAWVPILVLSAPIVGPPYNPLSPLELLAGAGWCLISPAELQTPERVGAVLARAGHRPAL